MTARWHTFLGLYLLGGFIVYLIAAGRLGDYLAIFVSPGPGGNPATGGGTAGNNTGVSGGFDPFKNAPFPFNIQIPIPGFMR